MWLDGKRHITSVILVRSVVNLACFKSSSWREIPLLTQQCFHPPARTKLKTEESGGVESVDTQCRNADPESRASAKK